MSEIKHYGIKGMKWGVRKEATKNFQSFLKTAESRRVEKFGSAISESDYKNLDTKDVEIKKGQILKRVSRDVYDDSKLKYLSGDSDDRYRAIIPSIGAKDVESYKVKRKYSDVLYETTYEAAENLTSPSEKTRVDAFAKVLGSKSIPLMDGTSMTGLDYLKAIGYSEALKGMDAKAASREMYGYLISHTKRTREPLNSAYFSEVSKRGYNILIDDNNLGSYSNLPVIALSSDDILKKTGIKKLSTLDIQNAHLSVKPPEWKVQR